MDRAAPMLLLFVLAGCGGVGAPPPGPASPAAEVRVGFGGIADTLTITAVERLPLRAAALVAPDGAATPASAISVEPMPRAAVGQFAKSNPWRDAVAGTSPLAALPSWNAQAGAALQSQEQLLATVSTADIPLPDAAAYHRDWPHYRIRLTFGTPPGEVELREIPAPPPAR